MTSFRIPRAGRRLSASVTTAAAAAAVGVGLLAAGGPAAANASTAHSSSKMTTVTIGVFAGNLLSADAALAEGYFAKNHINAELKTLEAGPAIVAATESGSVDIGVGDTLAWAAAVDNGFSDLDLLQGSNENTPAVGSDEHMIAGPGITSPSQLAGKTIGYIPYPEMTVATDLWLQKNGVKPSSVKLITITDGTQATLLEKGDAQVVEGRNLGEDESIATEAKGKDLGEIFNVLPDHTMNVSYFAKKSWLQGNKTVDSEVAAALREGTAYIRTAPVAKLAQIADKYAGFDYTALAKQYPGILQKTDWYREAPPVFNATAIAATNQWVKDAVKEGQVKKAFNITPYLWPTATESKVG